MKSLLSLSRKSTVTSGSSTGALDTSSLREVEVSPLGTKRKSFFRRQASVEDAGVFKLTPAEYAFLPTELRRRLGRTAQLPPAPSVFKSRGAVMFVDVSGFTLLGEQLRAAHGPVQGGALLAERITLVISQLATLCLDFGGDVSKFAGDALLCVWEGGTEEQMLNVACECAVAMLGMMREQKAKTGSMLEIHGGLARGSILHFHLGSADDQLRWYLMAGEALAGATALVDVAQPGEMLCLGVEALTATTRSFALTLVLSPPSSPRADTSSSVANAAQRTSAAYSTANRASSTLVHRASPPDQPKLTEWPRSSNLAGSGVAHASEHGSHGSQTFPDDRSRPTSRPARSATVTRDSTRLHLKYSHIAEMVKSSVEGFVPRQMLERDTLRSLRGISSRSMAHSRMSAMFPPTPQKDAPQLHRPPQPPSTPPPIIVMTADTPAGGSNLSRGRATTEDDPILRAGLPRYFNVYIPKALRNGLDHVASEMRHDVGVLFVDVEALALTDQEMASHSVSDSKLDDLNAGFVKMTRAVHCFGGEVRDMLFDDKGCVFIATFGAHPLSAETRARKRVSMRGLDTRSSALRAVLAALAISSLVQDVRVGVSNGACFVGMCGVEKRHDFIVIGHEVNMAARLMVEAERGQIVVSREVHAACGGQDHLQFTEREVHLRKKDRVFSDVAYVVDQAYAKREDFVASYRYQLLDQDVFVGRTDELESIDLSLGDYCLVADSKAGGVILIEGPDGIGKSALAARVRMMGKGRIAVCAGGKLGLNSSVTDFHAFTPVLQSLMGIRPGMRKQEVLDVVSKFKHPKTGAAVDVDALAWVLPFLGAVLSLHKLQEDLGPDPYAPASRALITQVAKAISWVLALGNLEAAAAGVHGTLLLLEHLEHMDPRSIMVLDQVVDHLDGVNRCAICITASTGPPSDPRKAALVELLRAKVKRNRRNLILDLDGLARDEADVLVQRVLGHAADERVVEHLFKASKGMPMHLNMALQFTKEMGLLARSTEGNKLYQWNGPPPALPPTLTGIIQARFEQQLSTRAKDILLTAAACRVEEFDVLFIVAVSPRPAPTEHQVLEAFFDAMEVGLVAHVENKAKPEVEHLWHFKHRLIEKALRDMTMAASPKPRLQPEQTVFSERKSLILRVTLGFNGAPEDFDKV